MITQSLFCRLPRHVSATPLAPHVACARPDTTMPSPPDAAFRRLSIIVYRDV